MWLVDCPCFYLCSISLSTVHSLTPLPMTGMLMSLSRERYWCSPQEMCHLSTQLSWVLLRSRGKVYLLCRILHTDTEHRSRLSQISLSLLFTGVQNQFEGSIKKVVSSYKGHYFNNLGNLNISAIYCYATNPTPVA